MAVNREAFSESVHGVLSMLEADPRIQSYLAEPKTHPVLEWAMVQSARPFYRLQHLSPRFWRIGYWLSWRGRYWAKESFIFKAKRG